jgi:ribosomal protein S18 acetylase RimI-like enzyme
MIEYRKAKKQHIRKLSEMIAETSVEFYEYLLSEKDLSIYDYSYEVSLGTDLSRYTDVALLEDKVLAMAFSYGSKYHIINEKMRESFSPNILNGLKECYENVIEDTLFLDSLFVAKDHRKKGIAKKLLSIVFDDARKNGLKGVSLFTLVKNKNAVNLYKNFGFSIENTFNLVPYEKAYLFYKKV